LVESIGGSWRVELGRLAFRQFWAWWAESDRLQAKGDRVEFAGIWRQFVS
jgi:hypothetical protein